jgi:hypothetical protein
MRKRPPYETEFSDELWFSDQGSRSLTHRNRFNSYRAENQLVKKPKKRASKQKSEQTEENEE